MKKTNLLIAVCVLFLALSACGSGKSDEEKAEDIAESILESATGGNVDIDIDEDGKKGEITIKTEDGELTVSGNKTELPDDFPSDVYVVKGEIQGVGAMSSKEGNVVTFGVLTDEDFTEVADVIKKEMESNSWKSTMDMNTEEGGMQMYTKDEKSATITVTKQTDGTEVAYMVSYKK